MDITEYKVLGKLPDLFTFEDGRKVESIADWRERRKEIYKSAVDLQYGGMPPEPEFVEVLPLYLSRVPYSLSGYRVTTGTRAHPVSFTMYVHHPKNAEGEHPTIIDGDQCWHKFYDQEILRAIADHDYLYVTFDRTELACDVRGLGRTGPLYDCYPDSTFGATAAWAWGYSRCVDALEKLGDFTDMKHIAFTGLSRGGKTALLAGAVDERAFLVNPEATCAGGGACYRIHMKAINDRGEEARSETLNDIYHMFPEWFGKGMEEYLTCEEKLPFDCHSLKALVAPRILFDSEAASDMWANPLGAYQSSVASQEVWKMYGNPQDNLWYYRDGYHNQTIEDYNMLLNLMDHAIYGKALSMKFYQIPFEAPEKIYDWEAPKVKA